MNHPPQIHQLSDDVANRIAAGEVVERPAAVAKELMENALDAGATRIVVTIEDGGRRLLQVEDDGHGMGRDDLALAVARHATSKLHTAADLAHITTLGFRGEALPSIAAVSEFAIASRTHDADQGWGLSVEGGRVGEPAPAALAPGTRVTVRNLFWNMPARLKFLGSERAELAAVKDLVFRIALGHPEVGVVLRAGDRNLWDFPADQHLFARLRDRYGKDFVAGLLPLHHEDPHLQISGFVGRPDRAASTSRQQYVHLAGRSIADKVIIAALREGFAGRLEPRLHPVAFLHLDVEPGLVDVNVHPTKAEVRFRERNLVFKTVRDAVAAALMEGAGDVALFAPPAAEGGIVRRQVVKAALPRPEPLIQERFLPREMPVAAPPSRKSDPKNAERGEQDRENPFGTSDSPMEIPPSDPVRRAGDTPAAYDYGALPGVRQIVQLADSWILVETDAGIRIIDQHALHEKALYLCLDGGFDGGGRQELLVPETIELSAAEMDALEPHLETLHGAGIEAEIFGPTTLLIRAFPCALRRTDWRILLRSLLEEPDAPDPVARLKQRIAHRRACHQAVKAGDHLDPAQLRELVRLLYTVEGLENCPHGRPTTLDLSWEELGKRFQR